DGKGVGAVGGVRHGAAWGVVGLTEVGRFAGERGDLRVAQPLAALHPPLVNAARRPVDLIRSPRDNARLRERAHARRVGAADGLHERVALARELLQRLLEQVVYSIVER